MNAEEDSKMDQRGCPAFQSGVAWLGLLYKKFQEIESFKNKM